MRPAQKIIKRWRIEALGTVTRDIKLDEVTAATEDDARSVWQVLHPTYRITACHEVNR